VCVWVSILRLIYGKFTGAHITCALSKTSRCDVQQKQTTAKSNFVQGLKQKLHKHIPTLTLTHTENYVEK